MVALVVLRAIILATALTGLTVWMVFIFRHPRRGGYGIAALGWLVNVGAFEAARMVCPSAFSSYMLNIWAQTILFQGALTLTGMGLFLARLK